jgi:hypothetical protein
MTTMMNGRPPLVSNRRALSMTASSSDIYKSELERFISDSLDTSIASVIDAKITKVSMVDEPLRWWRERGEHSYLTLASMAYDLFSIPVISSECKHAFSASERPITDHRYNLENDIIEADQCIKSSFKHGITDGAAAFTNIALINDEIIDITSL